MPFDTLSIPTLGMNNGIDGSDTFFGRIFPSPITGAYWVGNTATPDFVALRNKESASETLDGANVNSTNGVGAAILADVDVGDSFFVALNNSAAYGRIWFNVSTPGVGTWSIAVRRFDIASDAWINQTITQDTTNAFRTAGLKYIEFTDTVLGLERLQVGETKYRWTQIVVTSSTTVTTAPVINRIVVQVDGTLVRNITTNIISNTVFATSWLPTANTYILLAMANSPLGVEVTRPVADNPVVVWNPEFYQASDGSWPNTIMHTDETVNLTVVSASENSIRWDKGEEWTSTTLNLTDAATGTVTPVTGFLFRWMAYNSPTAVGVPGRMAVRYVGLGTAGDGIPMKACRYEYLTYEIAGTVPVTNTHLQLINITTGAVCHAIIGGGNSSSYYESQPRVLISPELTFSDGDEFTIQFLSADTSTNVSLHFHYNN